VAGRRGLSQLSVGVGGDRVVAAKLGASAETVRKWIRHAEVDARHRPEVSTEESPQIKKLRREVAELRRPMRFSRLTCV